MAAKPPQTQCKWTINFRLYCVGGLFWSSNGGSLVFALIHIGLPPHSLHQGMSPGYPPAMPGSIPAPYQLARDPQSGQLIVIPAEHLSHYGKGPMGF